MLCTGIRGLRQGVDGTKSPEEMLRQQMMDIFMKVPIWQRITGVMVSPGTSAVSSLAGW